MTIDIGWGVQMYTRAEWGARPPRAITSLNPTFGTTKHYNGPPMGSVAHSQCPARVRAIQNFHMDAQDWTDTAYTYLVCEHGWAFEGRGRFVRTAANGTTIGNNTAYAVMWMGGDGDTFTEATKRASRACFDRLSAIGSAGPGRNCHMDWKSTSCPGVACPWIRAGLPVQPLVQPLPSPEDDLPTPAEVWAHPLRDKVAEELNSPINYPGMGPFDRPAGEIASLAHWDNYHALARVTPGTPEFDALVEAVADAVWDKVLGAIPPGGGETDQKSAAVRLAGAEHWAYQAYHDPDGPPPPP